MLYTINPREVLEGHVGEGYTRYECYIAPERENDPYSKWLIWCVYYYIDDVDGKVFTIDSLRNVEEKRVLPRHVREYEVLEEA